MDWHVMTSTAASYLGTVAIALFLAYLVEVGRIIRANTALPVVRVIFLAAGTVEVVAFIGMTLTLLPALNAEYGVMRGAEGAWRTAFFVIGLQGLSILGAGIIGGTNPQRKTPEPPAPLP